MLGDNLITMAIVVVVAVSVGAGIFAIIFPMLEGSVRASRVKAVTSDSKKDGSGSLRSRLNGGGDKSDTRRKQIQDSLNQIDQRSANLNKKKKLTLRVRLEQSGLDLTPRSFYIMSLGLGLGLAFVSLIFRVPFYVTVLLLVVGGLGVPRWVLNNIRKRRQNKFLNDFADAIDVLVRGLKSGLPIGEAMKIISTEQGPPVGPEFLEVVEGQRIGIPLDQGIERMVERVPLPEVNFLAIVMTIQSKTGGNLSEALANLSRVLRDRKRMKAKVQAVSQEAKSSAAIIGALPFVIVLLMSFLNPDYLLPLFNTHLGNIMLAACGIWMSIGVLVMRKMINIKI